MGVMQPPRARPLKPPRTIDQKKEAERMKELERRRLLEARGRRSTILTSGGGDRSVANIGRTTLGGY